MLLWRVWTRRVRSLRALRVRGVGTVGRITGRVRIWSKGESLWIFHRFTYATAEGRLQHDVPSVVSVWDPQRRAKGKADIIYDPEHPEIVSRPLSPGFVLRTVALAVCGLLGVAAFLVGAYLNLPI